MNKRKVFAVVFWVVSFQLIGGIMGYLTQTNMNPWYQTIIKSPFTPPNITFGIVWPILYVLLAFCPYLLYSLPDGRPKPLLLTLFWSQMVLNWMWTPIFFGAHLVLLAMLILVLMVLLTVILWIRALKDIPVVSYLLTPYILWIAFATYLTWFIWWNN